MEGEGLRSSQGISVPVFWADTQNTSHIRTIKDIVARSLDATHCVQERGGTSAGIQRSVSLCPQVGPVLEKRCDSFRKERKSKRKKERTPQSSKPFQWFTLVGHGKETICPRLSVLWSFVGCSWKTEDSYLSDGHRSGVCVEPHQVGPRLHQQLVSLLCHLWPEQRPTLNEENTVVRCRMYLCADIISLSVTHVYFLYTPLTWV